MFKGQASPVAAREFLERHRLSRGMDAGQFREMCGIPVSSLGLGTYLGNMDDVTDAKVAASCVQSVERGCNIFDSAINYRGQRGERSVGEGIRRAILSGKAKREELFVSTKGGFIPYEAGPTTDIVKLFQEYYVDTGIAKPSDLVAGCHSMAPSFLQNQIERSRKNLGLETIDLYYLHNPETQLEELPARVFYEALEEAFGALEIAVKEGRIGAYGLATWNGLREESSSQTAVQLEKVVIAAERAAKTVGNDTNAFKAIQLPLNLAMPEGALLKTQRFGHNFISAIDAAHALGLSVAVSVPLFQARLCHSLPEFIVEKFPKDLSQAHCALAFATAFPSVDAAMVGMKHPEHVAHNLEFLKHKPLSDDELRGVIESMLA